MAGARSAGRGIWSAVAVAAALAAALAVVLVVLSHRDASGAPTAGPPPPATPTTSAPAPTPSPSASTTPTPSRAAAPVGYPGGLLRPADVRAVPAQGTSAWDGPAGWAATSRPRATYACAPHVPGAAPVAFEDTTYAEHRDTLDQEAVRYAGPADAQAALLALRRELGACASRSALVDLFAGWRVVGVGDEAQLVDLQVPGQPATFAPGDSAVHLVEVWLVRRGPVLSVLSFGHYDQDQPAPATGFGAAAGSALCRAAGSSCSPRPVLHQTYGDPLPAAG